MRNRVIKYIGLGVAWVACLVAGCTIGGKIGEMVAEDMIAKREKNIRVVD